jgi:hypothetical protein
MNKIRTIILIGIILLISSNLAILANATPNNGDGTLNDGYSITNNYHGQTVPMGAEVIATATTTDHRVDEVQFIWKNPAEQTVFVETVDVYTNGSTFTDNDGHVELIYYADSSFNPESLGDWCVIAKFYDEAGFCFWQFDILLATRATSFNVIPEVPLLGTAGVSIAMLLGLGIVKVKRKQQ